MRTASKGFNAVKLGWLASAVLMSGFIMSAPFPSRAADGIPAFPMSAASPAPSAPMSPGSPAPTAPSPTAAAMPSTATSASQVMQPSPQAPTPNPAPVAMAAPPTISPPAITGQPMPLPSPVPVTTASVDNAAKNEKNLSALETKASDSVKDVIKRFGTPADNVTLDDLNSARQAVAKIEAMIDIEKHLADLDKIRQEREGKSLANIMPASAIPASALAPTPLPTAPLGMGRMGSGEGMGNMGMRGGMNFGADNDPDILRIVGTNGRYVAVLKGVGDAAGKTLSIGDKTPDGSVVESISASSMELKLNGKTRIVHVKDVASVFGAVP